METEIWKDIIWYEGMYQASNLGRIKSLWRNKIILNKNFLTKEIILKNKKSWKYNQSCLYINHNKKYIWTHRLIASAFLWLNINDRWTLVCHRDDNPLNNRLYNLFLGTPKDNMQDMINKWRNVIKWRKILQYSINWEFIKEWISWISIERELLIRSSNILECCKSNRNKAWWYVWKYKF